MIRYVIVFFVSTHFYFGKILFYLKGCNLTLLYSIEKVMLHWFAYIQRAGYLKKNNDRSLLTTAYVDIGNVKLIGYQEMVRLEGELSLKHCLHVFLFYQNLPLTSLVRKKLDLYIIAQLLDNYNKANKYNSMLEVYLFLCYLRYIKSYKKKLLFLSICTKTRFLYRCLDSGNRL